MLERLCCRLLFEEIGIDRVDRVPPSEITIRTLMSFLNSPWFRRTLLKTHPSDFVVDKEWLVLRIIVAWNYKASSQTSGCASLVSTAGTFWELKLSISWTSFNYIWYHLGVSKKSWKKVNFREKRHSYEMEYRKSSNLYTINIYIYIYISFIHHLYTPFIYTIYIPFI